MEELKQIRAAGCGSIHLSTSDEEETIREIIKCLKGPKYLYTSASGLSELFKSHKKEINKFEEEPAEFLGNLDHTLADLKTNAIMILVDVHSWIEDDAIIRRALVEAANEAKREGWFIILLDAREKPHKDLGAYFSTLKFPRPDYAKTAEKLKTLLDEQDLKVSDPEHAVTHLLGLAAHQQTDAISLAIADALRRKDDEIDTTKLRHFKEREVGKTSYLKITEPTKRFESLIGHQGLKKFLQDRYHGFSKKAQEKGLSVPRGMLLVGPPGTGKSRFAEATAGEWGVPYLQLDFSAIFGSYLGESEGRLNSAIELAEKCSPCILLIDEIERSFGRGSERDGGTSERVTGRMLNWLADKKSPVFVVFTANTAENLPAALIRKGRLDEIFCLDFPLPAEREQIWTYYLKNADHGLNESEIAALAEKTSGFSPAEIESMVEAVKFKAFSTNKKITAKDLDAEIHETNPISKTMSTQIEVMRAWANSHARSTN